MTNQEILEKAIRKAIDGGWGFSGSNKDATITVLYRDVYFETDPYIVIDWHMPTEPTELSVSDMILNPKFTKALWGWDVTPNGWSHKDGSEHVSPAWELHLQRMVIAEDPIKYLGENI